MSNKIILKKSSVVAKVPLTSDLEYGELALNYADGKLYFKNSSNVVNSFAANVDLSAYATLTGSQTLTNKAHDNTNSYTTKASLFTLQDATDITKQAVFSLSGITTGTTRTYTLPNASTTLIGLAGGTFSGGVSFSGSSNYFGTSTATGTIELASGATISGATKTVNIGTGGVSGSTTNITIGSTNGSTTTVNGAVTLTGTKTFTGTTVLDEIRYVNSYIQTVSRNYPFASYLTTGETQKVLTIIPNGSSQNYSIYGKVYAQTADNTQCMDIECHLRSNTLPSLSWEIYYDEDLNGITTPFVKPVLWTNQITGGFILAFEYFSGGTVQQMTVDLDVVHRGSNYSNVSIYTGAEVTTIDTNYTQNYFTLRTRRTNATTADIVSGALTVGGVAVPTISSTSTLTNKTIAGATISGSLIPSADATYDLGSSTYKFKDLYLSGTSLFLNQTSMQTHASGIAFTHSNNTTILPVGGGSHTLVTETGTATLTNKTLTAPNITGTVGLTATTLLSINGNTGNNGQFLARGPTGLTWTGAPTASLVTLTDVAISNAQPQQVLTYTGSAWINADSNAVVASAVFATTQADLGFVYDSVVNIQEDLGPVNQIAYSIYDLGVLSFTGIISLNNIDQSVKSDYIGYSIIFGF